MATYLKENLMHLAEILHVRIFGHEMGGGARDFLKNLSFSFLGGVTSAALLFVANVIAGRVLGPEEYGKYGLIIAIAMIMIIFTTAGMDTASMHFISKNREEKSRLMATSFWTVLALTLFFGGLGLVFAKQLSAIIGIDRDVFSVAIIFAALLGCKNLLDAFIRGLRLFGIQARIKVKEAVVVVLVFLLLLISTKSTDYRIYVTSLLLGMVAMILMAGYKVGKELSYKNYSQVHLKKIFTYGIFSIIGATSGVLLSSIDKILINKYVGAYDVGVYNAYFTASVLLITNLTVIFVNVFFPCVSSMKNHANVLKKLNKLAIILLIPAFFVLAVLTYEIVLVFGKEYPINWLLIVLFSLFSIMNAYFMVLWWLIASHGVNGVRFTSLNGIIAGLIFVSLSFFFRNYLSLYYVILFLMGSVAYAIAVGNMFYYEKSK